MSVNLSCCAGSCPCSVIHVSLQSSLNAGAWMKQAISCPTQGLSGRELRYVVSCSQAKSV